MSSDVDICNMALAHLGARPTVASIDPPEESAEAELLAIYYPIARDALLERHAWSFATRRVALAVLDDESIPPWDYVYARPNGALRILAVQPAESSDDYVEAVPQLDAAGNPLPGGTGRSVPQPFVTESLEDGTPVILSDQEDAICRFIARVEDPARFSTGFVEALSWAVAARMAGPLIKGEEGRAETKRCEQMLEAMFARARDVDTPQRNVVPHHLPAWIASR